MKVGCNYWASNAGLKMWNNWDPQVIDNDFQLMSEYGINIVRVFPIWPEFQKLEPVYGGAGRLIEIRGGIDNESMKKFEVLVDIADKYNISLIVSLINGWMSGKLFVPSVFYNRNVLIDPEAIKYQAAFVSQFVNSFKNKKSITAWDLGNECNIMGEVESSSQAWLWANTIASSIRSADRSRPVYAGMHGLTIDGLWKISDIGDICDVVTTHPYPLFTPHCGKDSLNKGRSVYHAVAESKFYSDLSQKPCIIEELGSLGPCVASEYSTAEYFTEVLDMAYREGIKEVLWWCAFDQPFNFPPYDTIALERELGLFTSDREPKATAKVIKDFTSKGNIEILETADAVCIMTADQDHWLAAYGSYILSSQAGIRIKFADVNSDIPKANIYLMPCITGYNVINKNTWDGLLKRIKNGAILYISYDGGFLTEFESVTGVRVENRRIENNTILEINPIGCDVIVEDSNGKPVLTSKALGKGKVIFCNLPLENNYISADDYKDSYSETIYKEVVKLWTKNA